MIYLCACVEVGRISWYVSALSTHFQISETVHCAFFVSALSTHFQTSFKQCIMPVHAFVRLSDDLQTFLNVLMHVDLFSGM